MEEPKSPVLSCKRPTRLANLSSGSPVLSNGRKRKRRPTDSPVFLRSTPSVRNFNGRESPIIENFCSPPSSLCDRGPARKLRPKSLLFNVDEIPLILVSPSSPIIGQKTKDQLIEEDSQSEDSESEELVICEKTITDTEDSLDASTKSDSSFAISQPSVSLSSRISTPERKVKQSRHVATGSARKKKQYLSNGLAKQLSKLLVRQESDYRLWRYQQKEGPPSTSHSECLCLTIDNVIVGDVHSYADCHVESGHLQNDRVIMVFTAERWERSRVHPGDTVSIYESWQSMEMGGVTVLLGFNLLLRKEVAEAKLSNKNVKESISDVACSSASADNIAAENRRPSDVTVLQTWSCPCQGCWCNFNLS